MLPHPHCFALRRRWPPRNTPSSVLDLGSLSSNATGYSGSQAYGINNLGHVVGVFTKYDAAHAYKNVGLRGFVWSRGQGLRELPTLGGVDSYYGQNNTYAIAINDSGVIVGRGDKFNGSGTSLGTFAFSSTGSSLTQLGTIDGTAYNIATAINASGTIVGRATQVRTGHSVTDQLASTFTASSATALPLTLNPDGGNGKGEYYSIAYGVNASGLIAGQYKSYAANGTDYGTRGFTYNPATATMKTLPTFGTQAGTGKGTMEVSGINDAGTVVGDSGMFDAVKGYQGLRSFLWTQGAPSLTEIGNLGVDNYGQTQSIASAINSRGQVVGSAYRYDSNHVRVGSGNRAYLYTDGTTYDLNDLAGASGWTLASAAGINSSGQIVGGGINPAGQGHAYLLTPVAWGVTAAASTGALNGVVGQQPGALTYSFAGQSTPGTISASWVSITDANSAANQSLYGYGPLNFTLPGQHAQLLALNFDSAVDPGASATITLTYDPSELGAGVDASTLGIYHYHNGAWAFIGGTVDPADQTITFQTDSFSPFMVGVAVPEPNSLAVLFLGTIGLLRRLR